MKTEQINRTRNHICLAYSLGYRVEPYGDEVKMYQRTTAGNRSFKYVATITRSELFSWLAPRHSLIYNAEYFPRNEDDD